MDIELARSDEAIERCSRVLRQLRPSYDHQGLVDRIKRQQQDGYRLVYAHRNGDVIAVAGFVIGWKLAWGKHIYVDDLVTDEKHRAIGAGHQIIAWLKRYARETECSQIHLDSGVQRFAAHRFYLRQGFNIDCHHFALTDIEA
jgi:GNAT superfamily N-acetyltransferase